jgi:GNAT superfamily N-acetyltransferase
MIIRSFLLSDVYRVRLFADQEIGEGYYTEAELIENQKKSVDQNGEISSFLLVDEITDQVKGLRLAYPPGNWSHGKGSTQRDDLWPHKINETAYFQSLFLSADVQGQGWGPKLSQMSIDLFSKNHVKGIATHSWKESPHNSSVRYLEKVGFKTIIEHPLYWVNVDYVCTKDGKPCRCTAVEMYLEL